MEAESGSTLSESTIPTSVLHPGQALEVGVLGPQRGAVHHGRGVDDAVGHGEPVARRGLRGLEALVALFWEEAKAG